MISNLDPLIDDFAHQSNRKLMIPSSNEETNNVPLSNSSTPVNTKKLPVIQTNLSLDITSDHSSRSTTPIPSPELHVPSQQFERRRSISPPLLPQMSPDNGRPIPYSTQTNAQRSADEHTETSQRSKASSRTQVTYRIASLRTHCFNSSRVSQMKPWHPHASMFILVWNEI